MRLHLPTMTRICQNGTNQPTNYTPTDYIPTTAVDHPPVAFGIPAANTILQLLIAGSFSLPPTGEDIVLQRASKKLADAGSMLDGTEYDKAISLATEAIVILRTAPRAGHGDGTEINKTLALAYVFRAQLYVEMDGRLIAVPPAILDLSAAGKIYAKIDMPYETGKANEKLGDIYRRSGNREAANKYYRNAAEILEGKITNGNTSTRIETYRALSGIYQKSGRLAEAVQIIEACLAVIAEQDEGTRQKLEATRTDMESARNYLNTLAKADFDPQKPLGKRPILPIEAAEAHGNISRVMAAIKAKRPGTQYQDNLIRRIDSAIVLADALIKHNPGDNTYREYQAELFWHKGLAAFENGRFYDAIFACGTSARIYRDFLNSPGKAGSATAILAGKLTKIDDTESARMLFRIAAQDYVYVAQQDGADTKIRMDDNNNYDPFADRKFFALEKAGDLFTEAGDIAEARSAYEKALAVKPAEGKIMISADPQRVQGKLANLPTPTVRLVGSAGFFEVGVLASPVSLADTAIKNAFAVYNKLPTFVQKGLRGGLVFWFGDMGSELIRGNWDYFKEMSVLGTGTEYGIMSAGSMVGDATVKELFQLPIARNSPRLLKGIAGRAIPLITVLTALESKKNGEVDWKNLPITIGNVLAASTVVHGALTLAGTSDRLRRLGRVARFASAGGRATLLGSAFASLAEFTIIKKLGDIEAGIEKSRRLGLIKDGLSETLARHHELLRKIGRGGNVKVSEMKEVEARLLTYMSELNQAVALGEEKAKKGFEAERKYFDELYSNKMTSTTRCHGAMAELLESRRVKLLMATNEEEGKKIAEIRRLREEKIAFDPLPTDLSNLPKSDLGSYISGLQFEDSARRGYYKWKLADDIPSLRSQLIQYIDDSNRELIAALEKYRQLSS